MGKQRRHDAVTNKNTCNMKLFMKIPALSNLTQYLVEMNIFIHFCSCEFIYSK